MMLPYRGVGGAAAAAAAPQCGDAGRRRRRDAFPPSSGWGKRVQCRFPARNQELRKRFGGTRASTVLLGSRSSSRSSFLEVATPTLSVN